MRKSADVAIIGLGNWGCSLAHACLAAGVALSEVVVRSRRSRLDSKLHLVRFEDAKLEAKVIWLCVRDGEIAETAKRIVSRRRRLDDQIVLHSSGALNSQALAVAKKAGAQVGSIAPVMSFPTKTPVSLHGVMFAVESGPRMRRQLEALVRRLGGDPFPIDSAKKPLYHAAATLASPLLVSELSAAMTVAQFAGLPPKQAARWVGALARATQANVIVQGANKSFSGPFARGDVTTIRLHLESLAVHPILKDIYRSLARHAVEVLPTQNRSEIKSLLGSMR